MMLSVLETLLDEEIPRDRLSRHFVEIKDERGPQRMLYRHRPRSRQRDVSRGRPRERRQDPRRPAGLDELHDARDIAVTADFREITKGVLSRHLKLDGRQLAGIFPGAPGARAYVLCA
jgi:hypothetical protein